LHLLSKRIEKTHVQPQLVFVGPEERLRGRPRISLEPFPDSCVEPIDLRLRDRVRPASKPRLGQQKTDSGLLNVPPLAPKLVIVGVYIEEKSYLVDVSSAYIAPQQMPEEMQTRVRQRVDRVECEIGSPVE